MTKVLQRPPNRMRAVSFLELKSSKMAKPPPNYDSSDSDYSASATLIRFDRPIPLLRRPVPASPTDDPNLGPYVLAFPNVQSFFSALKFCESKLLEQCEAGFRIGCSITASNKCRPPWWKTLFGKVDFRERSECEDREMAACLEGSKDKCANFAKEKCVGPFGWARVARGERKLREKEVGRLISCVSGLGISKGNAAFETFLGDQLKSIPQLNLSYEVSTIRGSEILGDWYQQN